MKKEDFVKLGISEDLAVQAADAVSEVLKNYGWIAGRTT